MQPWQRVAAAGGLLFGLGGCYTGAIALGSKNEKYRRLLEDYLPASKYSLDAYNRLKGVPPSSKASQGAVQGMLVKNGMQLDSTSRKGELMTILGSVPLMTKLQGGGPREGPDFLSDLKVEEQPQTRPARDGGRAALGEGRGDEEYIAAIMVAFKSEEEARLKAEFQRALDAERQVDLERLRALDHRVESVELRMCHMSEEYMGLLHSIRLSTIVESLCMVIGMNARCHAISDKAFLGSTLRRIFEEFKDKEDFDLVHSVGESISAACDRIPNVERLDCDYLLRGLLEAQPLALEYADFGSSHWVCIFPTFKWIRRSLSSFDTFSFIATQNDHVKSQLEAAEAHLRRGDLKDAVLSVNGITGWPRVALKEWLDLARSMLEIEDGLCLLQSYALGRKLHDIRIR